MCGTFGRRSTRIVTVRMGRWGNARAGWMVRAMQEQVRDTGRCVVKGLEIRIPPAFATGTGEGPTEGHFGSSDDGQ